MLVTIRGRSTDIDSVVSTVWGGTVAAIAEQTYTHFIAPETIQFVSLDADDTIAGAGAQKVMVVGLDANGNPQSQELDTDGLTDVVTTTEWTAVNDFWVTQAGATGTAEDLCTIVGTDSSATYAVLPAAGAIKAFDAVYTVPTGFSFHLGHVQIGILSATALSGALQIDVVRDGISGSVEGPYHYSYLGLLDGRDKTFHNPLKFVAGDQLSFSIAGLTTANSTGSLEAYGYLKPINTRYV